MRRRGMVFELALQGASYSDIAEQLRALSEANELPEGMIPPRYDKVVAWKDLNEYLKEEKRLVDMQAEEYRTLEDRRLNHLLQNLQEGIRIGDTNSIGAAIRISESRRRMYGLDMPERHELSGPDGGPIQTEDMTQDLLALLDKQVRGRQAAEAKDANA